MRRLSVLLCLLSLVTSMALAQGLKIAGKVTDKETGDPLPGVSVTVKGSTVATMTGHDGSFQLSLPNLSEATLVFSRVGYKAAEEQVTGSTSSLAVALEEAPLNEMEEMVITGMASSVKRQNLANAIATISTEEISRVPVQSLDAGLAGKFPGVIIRENSGAPGGGMKVKLRGLSTINGSSQPLYVLDGVILNNAAIQAGVDFVTNATGGGGRDPQDNPTNRIADINPYDIESMEILKGPSSAAIYGSKATNGVVIITTKKGQPGDTQFDLTLRTGQRSIIKKLGQRVFTEETVLSTWGAESKQYEEFLKVADANGNYEIQDFEEQLYGNDGTINETNFSARGGGENTRFYVSGYNLDDEGIIENTGFTKSSVRINVDHDFTEKISISAHSFFVKSESDRGLTNNENNNGTTFGVALTQTPNFFDLRPDADGNYPVNPFASSNPLQTRDLMTNRETVYRTINGAQFDWELYATERQILDFNITGGVDFFSQENVGIFPATLQFEQIKPSLLPGTSILGETESTNSNLFFNLIHSLISADGNNTFTTQAGVQFENSDSNRIVVIGEGLVPGTSNIDNAAAISFSDQIRTLQRDQGFFLQEEVQFGEAIYVAAGIRGDSSSSNGDPDKDYLFPKAAFSIRLSQYEFWKPISKFFTEFKLRTAWGKTSNLPPPAAKFDSFASTNIGGAGGLLALENKGNPNIEPETASEFEFGFDAAIKNSRATLEFTYFKKDIEDLILRRNLASSSGFQTTFENGGEMETEGWEIGLGFNPVSTPTWDWTARLNFFTVDNVITQLDGPAFDLDNGGFATVLGQHRIEEGRSATQIVGVEGDQVLKIGDETPDFQMAWDNYLSFKRWSLSWLLDWKEGGETINLTYLLSDLNGTSPDLDTQAGQDRAAAFGQTTHQLVEDSSYFKLREIRLQYDIANGPLNRWFKGRISHMHLALSGRNIWTDTDYNSYDPEVSNFGNASIGSVEVAPFPTSKAYYFEISAGL